MELNRRSLLALSGASLIPASRLLANDVLTVPSIDRLELTVLIDSTTSVFGASVTRPDIRVVPPPITADYHKAFAGQWGYSLLAKASAASTTRTILIDFRYTPDALLNNMALLGVEPATIDATVLSHGHYDHFGGLDGFLATGKVRRGAPLFVGGEEAFCARVRGTDPDGSSFGAIDRPAIRQAGIDVIVTGDPRIVAGRDFTRVEFRSSRQNCDRSLLEPAKRDKAFVVDDAEHELGTAFNLAGHGLVVVGSCSHRGIINTVRRAQSVSGIEKVHAVVGGFHLLPPQTREQAMETLALMQAINPDYVIPGHCTGETFIAAALEAMPQKVIRSIVGTRYIFGSA